MAGVDTEVKVAVAKILVKGHSEATLVQAGIAEGTLVVIGTTALHCGPGGKLLLTGATDAVVLVSTALIRQGGGSLHWQRGYS